MVHPGAQLEQTHRAVTKQTGAAVLRDHAVELPATKEPARSGRRSRRMCDDRQAAQETPLTMMLLAKLIGRCRPAQGVLGAAGSNQPREVITTALIEDGRFAQDELHRLHRGGQALIKTVCRRAAAHLDGTGRQRPAGGVRRRRRRRAAVEGAMLAKMRNGGEACTAAQPPVRRHDLLDDFTDKFVKMGDESRQRLDPSTKLGPLVNPKQVASVQELVNDAVEKGAKVAVGGQAPGGPGNFYPATVLTEVPPNARILPRRRCSGPVALIVGFDTEEQGVAAPTTPSNGLAAYIFTWSLTARCGWPSPSTPAWWASTAVSSPTWRRFRRGQESGFGREGGFEGIIEEYLDIKYIALTK